MATFAGDSAHNRSTVGEALVPPRRSGTADCKRRQVPVVPALIESIPPLVVGQFRRRLAGSDGAPQPGGTLFLDRGAA